MEYKDKTFFRDLLDESPVIKKMNLSGKYYERFLELLTIEYLVKNTPIFVNSKYEKSDNAYFKLLIVSLGALLSILLWPFYNRKIKVKEKDMQHIVFVSFADYIVRHKHVFSLLEEPVSVLYPPVFHYGKLDNHIKHFNSIGKPIHIGCFHLLDWISASIYCFKNIGALLAFSRKIDEHFGTSGNKFLVVYYQALVYSLYFKRLLKKLDRGKRVWFLDYDLDCKYIVLNQLIHENRDNDVSVHMQHGIFHVANCAYSDNVSDYDCCCSEREKQIIINGNNHFGSTVVVQGCPLQSLQKSPQHITKTNKVLVLLTATDMEEAYQMQVKLLEILHDLCNDTLLRFRPASRYIDEDRLKPYTVGFKISNGTTLEEDVYSSECVISFSEDSVFSCFRSNTRVVLFVPEAMRKVYKAADGESKNMMVCSEESLNVEQIYKFIQNQEPCDYFHDDVVLYDFGIFDFESYKSRFRSNLKNIVNASF